MSLWTGRISANNPVTIIKKHQPAPFDGVLSTEDAFRNQVNTIQVCTEITERELTKCQKDQQENKAELISVSTVTAFLLGGLSVYFIKR